MADNWTDQISALLDEIDRAEAGVYDATLRVAEVTSDLERHTNAFKEARRNLAALLADAGVATEHHPRAVITLASGRAKLVGDLGGEHLPDSFVRIKREPDKGKILKALTEGQSVPGYSIGMSPPVLTIKPKETRNV